MKSNAKNIRKINWPWLIFGVVFLATIIIAVCLNFNSADHSATKILSAIDIDNSDQKINWDKYQTTEITLPEISTITKSGTYHLTGNLTGAPIMVDSEAGEVRLILDNVTVNNSTGPAILCSNASDLVIELVGDNSLQDGSSYENYDEDITGAIYSKADLFIGGEGSLTINAKNQTAIKGKDDVKFSGGNYNISAPKDAIHGKNSVYFVDGKFTISAVENAIETTNETDYGKGFILVEGGEFSISAGQKGFKSVKNLLFYDGNINITSFDDSIHANNYVGIIGGDFNIGAGDDAIHADRELIIDGGKVNVTKSYEGLEAQVVTINGGQISVTSSDDGINAGGGADDSSTNRAGANNFAGDEDCVLSINGGEIYINAAGDGVDSNGYLIFNGGKTVIDGPTDDGNGALDSGLGINIQGGEVVAVGSSGMAESLGADGAVCNLSVYFDSYQAVGTQIEIKDSNNTVIVSHTTAKKFNHFAAGTDKFTLGDTYSIYLNGEKYSDFTITSVSTTVGNGNRNFQNSPNNNSPRR